MKQTKSVGIRIGIFILAFTLGLVNVLAFAPFQWWPLAPVSLAGLIMLWQLAPRHAFGTGWYYGMGLFGFGTFWIYHSLSTFGNMPWWMAGPMVVILVLVSAFWIGLVGSIYRRLSHWQHALWLIPPLWVLSEIVREWAFTGFPWLAQGYTGVLTFAQNIGAVGGVYGLSFFVVLVAMAIVCLLSSRMTSFVSALAIAACFLFIGYMTPQPEANGTPINVMLVQANVDPFSKWHQRQETVALYRRLSSDVDEDELVIWPETAIPFLRAQMTTAMIPDLPASSALIAGVIDEVENESPTPSVYNSIMSLGAAKGHYYKQHLVPFGEYLPMRRWLSWGLDYLQLPFSDLSEGAADQPPIRFAGQNIGAVICYEDTFANLMRKRAIDADFLLTSSEEAWFGPSFAAHQRLQMAQMRAIENGRDVIRSSNSGLSAIIGMDGRIKTLIPMFERASVKGQVQPYVGRTLYNRIGNWGIYILVVLWLAIALMLCAGRYGGHS